MDLNGSILSLFLAAMLVEYGCGLEGRQRDNSFVECFNGGATCRNDDLRFNCSSDEVISVQEYIAAFSITWEDTAGSECLLPSDLNCFSEIKEGYNIKALCDNEQSCQLNACQIVQNALAVTSNGQNNQIPNAVSVNYTCNTGSGISSTTEAGSPSGSTTAGGEEENDPIIIAVTVSVIVVIIIIVIVLVVTLRKKKNSNTKGATTDQISSSTKEPNRLSYSTQMIDNMDYQTSDDVLPNKGFHDNRDETEIVENLEYSTFTDKGCPTSSDDKRRGLELKQVHDHADETEIVENLEYSAFNEKGSPTLSDNKRGALGLKQVSGDLPAKESFSDTFCDQISGKSGRTHGSVPGYEDVTIEGFQNTNTPNQILKQVNGFMKPELPKKPGTVASNGMNSNGGYKGSGHDKQPTAYQIFQESPNHQNGEKHTSLPKEKGPLGDNYTMVVKQ